MKTFAIPSGGGVLRHYKASAQGSIVTANSGVNKSGLFEIGTLSPNRSNQLRVGSETWTGSVFQ